MPTSRKVVRPQAVKGKKVGATPGGTVSKVKIRRPKGPRTGGGGKRVKSRRGR